MIGKHAFLTDKLILVSDSGFSRNALDKARKYSIETVGPDEESTVDWNKIVNDAGVLRMGRYAFRALLFKVTFQEEDQDTEGNYATNKGTIIYHNSKVWGSLEEIGNKILDIDRLRARFAEMLGDDEENGFVIEIPERLSGYIIMESGEIRYVRKIEIIVWCRQDPFKVDFRMSEHLYDDAKVIVGEYQNDKVEAMIVVTEENGREKKFSALVATRDGRHVEMFEENSIETFKAIQSHYGES